MLGASRTAKKKLTLFLPIIFAIHAECSTFQCDGGSTVLDQSKVSCYETVDVPDYTNLGRGSHATAAPRSILLATHRCMLWILTQCKTPLSWVEIFLVFVITMRLNTASCRSTLADEIYFVLSCRGVGQ